MHSKLDTFESIPYYDKNIFFKDDNNNEFLLLPKMPEELRLKFFEFYKRLIIIFYKKDYLRKNKEAEEIFLYLIMMRNFLDINKFSTFP